MWFDLRGSQEMGREPTPPDINVSWLGPWAITIIFTLSFVSGLYLGLVVQGFPMLLGIHSFPLTFMAALTWGKVSRGRLLASCVRKCKVLRKAKGFLVQDVSAVAHIATTTRFGQGSILGGRHATAGKDNSGCGGKLQFFKLLTLQHFLQWFCDGLW